MARRVNAFDTEGLAASSLLGAGRHVSSSLQVSCLWALEMRW